MSAAGEQGHLDYFDAVEKLKTGEDLAWRASPHVVAAALNEALNSVRADRDRLREALMYIAGFDVAGYEAHLRPEDVAHAALEASSEPRP